MSLFGIIMLDLMTNGRRLRPAQAQLQALSARALLGCQQTRSFGPQCTEIAGGFREGMLFTQFGSSSCSLSLSLPRSLSLSPLSLHLSFSLSFSLSLCVCVLCTDLTVVSTAEGLSAIPCRACWCRVAYMYVYCVFFVYSCDLFCCCSFFFEHA